MRGPTDAGGWFVGDYTGLVARRDGFTALFAMAGDDPADVFASGEPGDGLGRSSDAHAQAPAIIIPR